MIIQSRLFVEAYHGMEIKAGERTLTLVSRTPGPNMHMRDESGAEVVLPVEEFSALLLAPVAMRRIERQITNHKAIKS